MCDDVFEEEQLRARPPRPSPTGYRDYRPPPEYLLRMQGEDDMPIHKCGRATTNRLEDSMSDDVFEEEQLRAPPPRPGASPTGYRDYRPPPEYLLRVSGEDDMPIHKVRRESS
ncbi:unnamed protein product [Plutella xylostella]|uniref:(diamondback moth) hypothetical protein n=1 Tax=Plutella xylostella TaxID=51655 RepID=A0A8S4DC71_PLUXY|nr:unnamed protein product [Plutella xylostella]